MAYDPYALDAQALQRRERMAMIMQQQALQPLEINSFQGYQAPISPLQGIAKVLQMYAGSKQIEEADEGRKDLGYQRLRGDMALAGVVLPEKRPLPQKENEQPLATTQFAQPTSVGQPQLQMPAVATENARVAESFPIGPSGTTQNLPPIATPVQYANALAGNQQPQTSQAPNVALPQGQSGISVGSPRVPSLTGNQFQDAEIIKQIGGQEYIKLVMQKKPTVVGNFAFDNNGKVIFSAPSKEGYVDVQGPTGSFSRKEVAGATELETSRATGVEYAKGAAGSAVKRDEETFAAASNAQTNIDRSNQIIDLVNTGALTGTAAEIKLKLARAFNVAGADNNEIIKNTEVLISQLGRNVIGNIKTSGLGTGQGFTDQDLKFLERIEGGSIDLNPKTLQELARISKSVSSAAVQKWNKRLPDIAPNIAKDLGLKPIELNNIYSRSEIEAEIKRRGLTR